MHEWFANSQKKIKIWLSGVYDVRPMSLKYYKRDTQKLAEKFFLFPRSSSRERRKKRNFSRTANNNKQVWWGLRTDILEFFVYMITWESTREPLHHHRHRHHHFSALKPGEMRLASLYKMCIIGKIRSKQRRLETSSIVIVRRLFEWTKTHILKASKPNDDDVN